MDLNKIKNIENLDFSDPNTKTIVISLLESMYSLILELKEENQSLKDEINKLKGEKGKPNIKPNKKKKDSNNNQNWSSESERKTKKIHNKSSKKDRINIDRIVSVELDKTNLPNDLTFKGYEEQVVQNIIIKSDNVLYKKEIWYSPSTKTSYIAELDPSLTNQEFDPDLKAIVVSLYYENNMSQLSIANFLNRHGILISEGTISNIITKTKTEELTKEVTELLIAGLKNSEWSGIDDTGLRVNGINHFCNIICNEWFSVYITMLHKNKDTISTDVLSEDLRELFDILVCDDAPQFKIENLIIALCWIHELRHFKKLNPIFETHKKELNSILTRLWEYYHKLLNYKENPNKELKEFLINEFDNILNTEVSFDKLDNRMNLTKAKKERLLVVLDYPCVPIHNNGSELGARSVVRKRKVCGGLRSEEGKKAWDNYFSIITTCKKLNVNFLEYIKNIFKGKPNPKSLSEIIFDKAKASVKAEA